MAERHRSKDGRKETEDIIGDDTEISQQGREGGALSRKIGTRDEEKRAKSKPAGATRVTGSDKRDSGIKEGDD
ncbi:hypothetical protein [Roseovarius aestuariivivens]|uniref:hypothetical protein n=1 Tax=Roseovarius aestuariivivens TaxID=1888910 RepID=UPI001081FFC1|nr:hypothetical protein [Roseovarius aestuariivivens]